MFCIAMIGTQIEKKLIHGQDIRSMMYDPKYDGVVRNVKLALKHHFFQTHSNQEW